MALSTIFLFKQKHCSDSIEYIKNIKDSDLLLLEDIDIVEWYKLYDDTVVKRSSFKGKKMFIVKPPAVSKLQEA